MQWQEDGIVIKMIPFKYELDAIYYQMKHPSWNRTTDGYKRAIKQYERSWLEVKEKQHKR